MVKMGKCYGFGFLDKSLSLFFCCLVKYNLNFLDFDLCPICSTSHSLGTVPQKDIHSWELYYVCIRNFFLFFLLFYFMVYRRYITTTSTCTCTQCSHATCIFLFFFLFLFLFIYFFKLNRFERHEAIFASCCWKNQAVRPIVSRHFLCCNKTIDHQLDPNVFPMSHHEDRMYL